MKRFIAFFLSIVLVLSVTVFPVFASDGKVSITTDGVYVNGSECSFITDAITLTDTSALKGTVVTKTYVVTTTNASTLILRNDSGQVLAMCSGYLDKPGNAAALLPSSNFPALCDKPATTLPATTSENFESAGLRNFKTGCKNYYYVCFKFSTATFGLLIQEESVEVNKTALKEAIDSALPTSGYYTENDRWNGSISSEKGFWKDLNDIVDVANAVYTNESATQDQVDAALATLTAALPGATANLISLENVNATFLYEAIHSEWRWQQGELSDTTGTPVSADNCTAITWDAYEQAKADGQTLLDSLYDDDGNPVEGVNTAADKQDAVNAAAEAADAHKLVNADLYNTAYENYQSRKAEAEALIEQYDPAKLNESDYSAETWAAYVSAYNVLKADMEYRIVRGTTEDYAMLKAFNGYYAYNESGQWTHYPAHIDALKDARKQLASTKDVTVSFTYINNFSALYEGFRGSCTDLYVNTSLGLASGNATLGAAFDAAGITVDMHNDTTLPGLGTSNNGDENPVFALYINGSHYGDYRWGSKARWNNVQLHDGDAVRLVRIPLQMFNSEDSSGYDSSKVSILPASPGFGYYESSYAMIHAKAPSATVKVGDEAAFSATVTGAYAGASGSKSAENITLFVSDPSETETLSQPTHKTTATTDASGNLEYIFREPGYYTIAMFNVTPDDMTYKSVYGEVTIGEYYSLYAGDYAIVHVTKAADINALIAKYRSENLAAAKAYYESFHDYDFTTADYRTFTSAYSTLKSNQNSATTFKELMDSFDTDYAALQAAGANALDHVAIIAALRKDMSYLPDDLTTLTAGNKDLVEEIQTAYAALNSYQKSLLTANEKATLEALAKINANELPAVATVNLRLSESGTFRIRQIREIRTMDGLRSNGLSRRVRMEVFPIRRGQKKPLRCPQAQMLDSMCLSVII